MTDSTKADLTAKKLRLEEIRAQLKTEFFGIDGCIDAIIESIKTWYLLPSIVIRPVIVNLWGLTGVGKTALVRSLVSKLGMTTQFVEVQMDGISSSGAGDASTIQKVLMKSHINEGQPGVILLDEFQRFRTVDDHGSDVQLERFADVWMLLSDGCFPNDCSLLDLMDNWLMIQEWREDDNANDEALAREREEREAEERRSKSRKKSVKSKPTDDLDNLFKPSSPTVEQPKTYKRKFNLYHQEAENIRQMLRCPESVKEIMMWDTGKARKTIADRRAANESRPLDYTKCLVFVSGNLDEAFQMSGNVEDCDTSADVFHEHTRKIGVTDIKGALATRFRPEQIARLGNNHVIYPSLSKSAYMSLIRRTCREYAADASKVCGITFEVDESVYVEVYENSVYPTQGTRPVFTSIHKLFGSPLSDAILWAYEVGVITVRIGLDVEQSSLVFTSGQHIKRAHIDFDIRARRAGRSQDFNALVAVHEAGHAIVYAELFHTPPVEVAINVASFNGGYNLFKSVSPSKSEIIDQIAVSMAGIVAEELIFGQELRSSGCESDVSKATANAARYVRRLAMDGYASMTAPSGDGLLRNDLDSTDGNVETLVTDQKARAQTILTKHRDFLVTLSKQLMQDRKMDAKAFEQIVKEHIAGLKPLDPDKDVNGDYLARLERA